MLKKVLENCLQPHTDRETQTHTQEQNNEHNREKKTKAGTHKTSLFSVPSSHPPLKFNIFRRVSARVSESSCDSTQ